MRDIVRLLLVVTTAGLPRLSDERPILLRHGTTSGHRGGQDAGQQIDGSTDRMAFLQWPLGALPRGAGGSN